MDYCNEDDIDYKNLKSLDDIDMNKLNWDILVVESPDELFTPKFVEKYKDKLIDSSSILRRSNLDEKYGFLDYILDNVNEEECFYLPLSKIYSSYITVFNYSNSLKLKNDLFKIKNKLIELSKKRLIDDKFHIILEGSIFDILQYSRTHMQSKRGFLLSDLILMKTGDKDTATILIDEIYYELAKQNIVSRFDYIIKLMKYRNLGVYLDITNDKLGNIEMWLKDEPISNLEILLAFDRTNLKRDDKEPEDFRREMIKNVINYLKD